MSLLGFKPCARRYFWPFGKGVTDRLVGCGGWRVTTCTYSTRAHRCSGLGGGGIVVGGIFVGCLSVVCCVFMRT